MHIKMQIYLKKKGIVTLPHNAMTLPFAAETLSSAGLIITKVPAEI